MKKTLLLVADLGQGGLQTYNANLTKGLIVLNNEVHIIVFKKIHSTEIDQKAHINVLMEDENKVEINESTYKKFDTVHIASEYMKITESKA